MRSPTFTLLGSQGFIASKHKKAISNIGGEIVYAIDNNSSNSSKQNTTQFTSICTPTYLHKNQVLLALETGHVICEKPLGLNLEELLEIREKEKETGNFCFTVFQLRYAPLSVELASMYANTKEKKQIEFIFRAPRNEDYWQSWKGESSKTGGLMLNIGIHYFDLLHYWFGGNWEHLSYVEEEQLAKGQFIINNLHKVNWEIDLRGIEKPQRNFSINGKHIVIPNDQELYNLLYEDYMGKPFSNTEQSIVLYNELIFAK